MCVIGEGEEGLLLKKGLVRLSNGQVYKLSDCDLKPGGRLILSMESVEVESAPRKKPLPSPVKGEFLIKDNEGFSFVSGLDYPVVELISYEEVPPPPPPPEIPYTPFAVVGGALLLLLKKVAGLDRALKSGSCEIRHQEAIFRISKLEGKVLRKQIVDGAKAAKGLKEKYVDNKEG